jgi:hypothetical protein
VTGEYFLPRLFISHSRKDNIDALAFQCWLMTNGWSEEDVFIDLHGIGEGERWRETLVKANVACEALPYLASPASLGSTTDYPRGDEIGRDKANCKDCGRRWDGMKTSALGTKINTTSTRPLAVQASTPRRLAVSESVER